VTSVTGDQHWQTYQPDEPKGTPQDDEAPPPPTHTPAPPYGATQALEPARLQRLRRPGGGGGPAKALLVGFIALAAVGGVGVGIAGIAGSDGVPGLGKPDALSDGGLDQLRADLVDVRGDTELFQAVIYPGYASVEVPVDGSTQRYETRYWDGDLDDASSKGTASYVRFDLADVDADVMTEAIATAKTLVDDPQSWYVVIYASLAGEGERQERPTITAYASNEFSESAYVEVRFNGAEVRRYVNGEVVEPVMPVKPHSS
jgi:hypothetical protein